MTGDCWRYSVQVCAGICFLCFPVGWKSFTASINVLISILYRCINMAARRLWKSFPLSECNNGNDNNNNNNNNNDDDNSTFEVRISAEVRLECWIVGTLCSFPPPPLLCTPKTPCSAVPSETTAVPSVSLFPPVLISLRPRVSDHPLIDYA